MWPRVEGLRAFSFGGPGEMRGRLTQLALTGAKVATAGLLHREYLEEGENVEQVGERQALIGDDGRVVTFVEITRVEVHAFADVPWEFAEAEGEGFRSIEHWRESHKTYYRDLSVEVDDSTPVVCVWFALVDVQGPGSEREPRASATRVTFSLGREETVRD